jgi:hypothetical protein
MIPHYDDEGRMDGDPEDLRFNVMPRREATTDDIIQELVGMDEMGLIDWYIVDGHPYIQMNRDAWEDHQTFKGIKRKESKIPAYDQSVHEKYKSTLQGGQVHPTGWTGKPHRVDRSTLTTPQVKLSKLDKSLSKDKQPSAADSSKHFSNKVESQYLESILLLCKKISHKSNGKKTFNVYRWVQQQINSRGHPGAVIKALNALMEYWDSTKNPEGYVNSIMKTENGNYYEQDHIKAHETMKQEWADLENSDTLQSLKGFLNGIFKGG